MNTCVVVVDRARARFFVLEPVPEHRSIEAPGKLREVEALTNPEGELTGVEVFSNTRSGSNRAPHGATFEYDDHRERHREEVERRFAKRVADATSDFARRKDAVKVVLAAEPHMLGLLRQPLEKTFPAGTARVELAEDLSWHSPEHVLDALVRQGALGATRRGSSG